MIVNEVSKESFSEHSFSATKFLNTFLSNESKIGELDVLSFKLKIIQRDLSNDVDVTTSSIIKSFAGLHNDFKTLNLNVDSLSKRFSAIPKTSSRSIDKITKAAIAVKFVNKLKYLVEAKKL